jgi:hypothetical protein
MSNSNWFFKWTAPHRTTSLVTKDITLQLGIHADALAAAPGSVSPRMLM